MRARVLLALSLALALLPAACTRPDAPIATIRATSALQGHVSFPGDALRTQAYLGEVASGAPVSLIDPTTGDTVASALTDAAGNFQFAGMADFNPAQGSSYLLEASKGLSVGGSSNRAGTAAVRIRTLLVWNGGWESLTSAAPGPVEISAATTALALAIDLRQAAGLSLVPAAFLGHLDGDTFSEAGTGLSVLQDFEPVLALVRAAIAADEDPAALISYDSGSGRYQAGQSVPTVTSVSPAVGNPGGTLTLRGIDLDRITATNPFLFGPMPAASWSVSSDGTTATLTIPTTAGSGPLYLTADGVRQTLSPMLLLHGTVGTVAEALAPVNQPKGMAVDGAGDVYVADYGHSQIKKITPSGQVIVLAGSGTPGFADGPAASAQFAYPYDVAVDTAGDVFVADQGNDRIREILPSGQVVTIAGNGTSGNVDGPAATAEFSNPAGVAVDAAGNLYVADYRNHSVREISAGNVTTIAGNGSPGFADGPVASAQFSYPLGVAIDGSGNLYVADSNNNRIREISGGIVTTLAGNGTASYLDGAAASAEFHGPNSVAVDASGHVFVADGSNNVIREISGGMVTTMAGSNAGYLDGPARSAMLNGPNGLALDADGDLYIADSGEDEIRLYVP